MDPCPAACSKAVGSVTDKRSARRCVMKLRAVQASATMLVVLGTVGLAEGQRRTEQFAITDGPFDFPVVDCGDFEVRTSYSMEIRGVVRWDSGGNETQVVQHLDFFDGIYYNEDQPDLFVEGVAERGNLRFESGLIHQSGASFRVRLSEVGIVFLEAGHLVGDLATGELLFVAGHHDLIEGNIEALCQALRPQ
jgi:hypothetical protein